MKLFGTRRGAPRLSPEQQALVELVAERLASGTLSSEEVRALLARSSTAAAGGAAEEDPTAGTAPSDPGAPESDEDAKARAMIEQIVREIDAERGR